MRHLQGKNFFRRFSRGLTRGKGILSLFHKQHSGKIIGFLLLLTQKSGIMKRRFFFVDLKSYSAHLYNKGHNFWKSVLTWKIPQNWIRHAFLSTDWRYLLRAYFEPSMQLLPSFWVALCPYCSQSVTQREGKSCIEGSKYAVSKYLPPPSKMCGVTFHLKVYMRC